MEEGGLREGRREERRGKEEESYFFYTGKSPNITK